jgi:hypothetical protein
MLTVEHHARVKLPVRLELTLPPYEGGVQPSTLRKRSRTHTGPSVSLGRSVRRGYKTRLDPC